MVQVIKKVEFTDVFGAPVELVLLDDLRMFLRRYDGSEVVIDLELNPSELANAANEIVTTIEQLLEGR